MGEEVIDLRRYLGILTRRWWVLFLAPLVIGASVYFYSDRQPRVYEAATLILVQETRSGLGSSYNDFQASQAFAATYRELITTRPVLEAILTDAGSSMSPNILRQRIETKILRGTQILRIAVRDGNPDDAARLANAVAGTFKRVTTETRLQEIAIFQSAASAQGLSSPDVLTAQLNAVGSLSIIEEAVPPSSPIFPRTRSAVVLAIAVGLLFGLFGAVAMEYWHDTVQSAERLERRFGVANLGTLPAWPRKDLGRYDLWIRAHPTSGYAEAVRQIKSALQFVAVSHPTKNLLITSPSPSEGKSTVAANLALALAEGGLRTVLVDLDLRRPTVHRYFQLENSSGVTTYLARPELKLETVLQGTALENLKVLTSGPIPPNPSELLAMPRMQGVFEQLGRQADIVVLDTPPLLVVADASLVAPHAGAAILVTDGARTRMDSVKASLEGLKKAGVPVFTVVNKMKLGFGGYSYSYRYHHYYRYRSYYRAEDEEGTDRNRVEGGIRRWSRLLRKVGRRFYKASSSGL